jgi:hypothetical protein
MQKKFKREQWTKEEGEREDKIKKNRQKKGIDKGR